MRNLKRVLALAMAMVMILGMMVIGSSAASYSDAAAIDADYAEAVEILSGMGVFKGTGAGFAPKQILTRAEAAALIYRVITGDVKDKQAQNYDYASLKDIKAGEWYTPYVTYANNGGYIKGDDLGNFNPYAQVTGIQVMAIMLRAAGYGQNGEYEGAAWMDNILTDAKELGITGTISTATLNAPATREIVAQLIFNAITSVDMVTYAPALGYIKPIGKDAENLSEKVFKLTKVTGIVDAVSYQKGTTTLSGVVVTDTDADFRDIGYKATVWAVKTAGAKTYTALSDVKVLGKSLGVCTDGTKYADLTNVKSRDYMATLDSEYDLYYNGVLVASMTTKGWDIIDATANAKLNNALNKVGTKIDFVDNDNGGKAEAVIVTEYTVAEVTGIANTTNTGYQATTKDAYYFDYTKEVEAKYLVTDDELEVGDLVVYVDYNTETYTDKAGFATGDLEQIDYKVVGGADVAYIIGGTKYVEAAQAASNPDLATKNLNKTFDVYTDPYGYILVAELTKSDINYLYVMANDHTVGTTGVTNTKVAYADGSIDANLNVASMTIGNNTWKTFNVNTIPNHIYTYTTNKAGNIELTLAHEVDQTANYVTKTATWGDYGVNQDTVVVDLRTDYVGTVYTGYAEIPSLTNGVICATVDKNGYIELAYLIGGTNTNDLTAEFIVYTTGYNYTNKVGKTQYYYLDVIVDGVVVEDYKLSADQYAEIVEYGVGVYEFGTDGTLDEYTSFAEEDTVVVWYKGSIKDLATNKYYTYANDTVKFNVLNITKGTVNDYAMVNGADYHAFLVYNAKSTDVVEIYIVVGDVSDSTTPNASQAKDGGVWYYVVENKKVTNAVFADAADCDVTVNGVPTWTVKAGDTITVPTAANGTGVKVTVGTEVSYVAYGSELVITADTAIETDYVNFEIDGKATAVKYDATVAVNTLTTNGTYVLNDYTTNWNMKSVASDSIIAGGVDHFITTGYYKVTVTDPTAYTVLVNGEAAVYETGANYFYVQSGVSIVAKENASQIETTYATEGTVLTADITIPFVNP